MLRPNRAIRHMKGLSEYFQNITKQDIVDVLAPKSESRYI